MPALTLDQARVLKDELKPELTQDPNVAGVGLARADGSWVVVVNLTQDAPLACASRAGVTTKVIGAVTAS
jgi:hypothetical protein